MQDGLLLVNKPQGLTSHDVLSHLRRALHTKRLGHTGTLDPMATGVLAVLVGQATRLSNYLMAGEKSYRATLCLGATTDTLDAEGTFLSQSEVNISPEDLTTIINSFVGPQQQLPPMYSAKKQGGKKLYELARAGIEIERKPCNINIYSISIVEISLPKVVIDVHCSSGTYIRVLASDIGTKAGCGAYLTGLIRTSVGPFTLAQTTPLEDLEAQSPEDNYSQLLSMSRALYNMVQISVEPAEHQRIIHGNPISLTSYHLAKFDQEPTENQVIALLNKGEVFALGRVDLNTKLIQPHAVLNSSAE